MAKSRRHRAIKRALFPQLYSDLNKALMDTLDKEWTPMTAEELQERAIAVLQKQATELITLHFTLK